VENGLVKCQCALVAESTKQILGKTVLLWSFLLFIIKTYFFIVCIQVIYTFILIIIFKKFITLKNNS